MPTPEPLDRLTLSSRELASSFPPVLYYSKRYVIQQPQGGGVSLVCGNLNPTHSSRMLLQKHNSTKEAGIKNGRLCQPL